MSFEDIKGHEAAVMRLKNAIKNNKIAHAYIFAGPRNSGRSLLAKNFAKALNCTNQEDFPCGTCVSCAKIDKGIHPDVKLLTYGGRGGDIIIEQIRGIENEIILKPYEGRYKVFIIEDAHLMNTAAANSFLKTLEEPPANSVVILITERPSDLPPTIASRCQIIRVKPLSTEELAKALTAEYGVNRDKVLKRFSDDKFVESVNSGERESLIDGLSLLAGWYRDILVYKVTRDGRLVINFDRFEDIKREEKLSGMNELLTTLENVLKARNEIENNVNPKLALSVMFVKDPSTATAVSG